MEEVEGWMLCCSQHPTNPVLVGTQPGFTATATLPAEPVTIAGARRTQWTKAPAALAAHARAAKLVAPLAPAQRFAPARHRRTTLLTVLWQVPHTAAVVL